MDKVAVTEADRIAAAEMYAAMVGPNVRVEKYKSGELDQGIAVQAFARHRLASYAEGRRVGLEDAAKVVDRVVIAGEAYTLGRLAAAIRAVTTE